MRYKYYKRPGRAYKVNRKRSRLAHEMTNGPTSQKALSVSGHTNHAGSFIYIHPNTTGDHTSAFQIPHSYHKILIVDIAHHLNILYINIWIRYALPLLFKRRMFEENINYTYLIWDSFSASFTSYTINIAKRAIVFVL